MSEKQQSTSRPSVTSETIREVALGETIDGFMVTKQLAESEAAILYCVTHPDHSIKMVMKVPKLHKNISPGTYSSFESEIRILSGLKGRYTPKLIASGDMARCPYFVIEYIEGDVLQQAIAEVPVAAGRVAELMEPVCKAVHELHRQNVIHLDLRPANVRNRKDGTAVIIDFGSAHHANLPDMYENALEDAPHSVAYVAPEQIHHIRTDSRSDIYAIGVMLYQLATANLPFGRKNLLSVNRRLRSAPKPPRAINADIPPWLQEIIYMCMEVYPDNRYTTAQKVAYLLAHPHMVELKKRSYNKRAPDLLTSVGHWISSFGANIPQHSRLHPAERLTTAPHILVALDLGHASLELKEAIRDAVRQLSQMHRQTFFTCLVILKNQNNTDSADPDSVKEHEKPSHVQAQVELRHWFKPLGLPQSQVNFQAHYGDAADEIIRYASDHLVDQIVMGARGSGTLHRLLGSVSQKVLAYAPCTVTVVKTRKDVSGDTGMDKA
ncbi:MAG: protein kinase [Acidiferrobacterales bacterium]